MPLPRLLNLKTVAIAQTVVIVFMIVSGRTRRAELDAAKVALEHPKVVTVVKTQTIQGPVRIKTVVVERTTGEKESTTIEERGEVVERTDSDLTIAPVPLSDILPRPANARFLLALDLRDLNAGDFHSWTGYAGVLLKDHLELRAGAGKREAWESHLGIAWVF